MKALTWISAAAIAALGWASCQTADAKYIDLATGEEVVLERDEEKQEMVNVETGEPVRLYVNTKTSDTIWGPAEKIVNNEVVRFNDMWVYAGDEEYKSELEKDGDYKEKHGDDYKLKTENDGDYKEKWGDDTKVKGKSNGSYKVKRGEHYKKEVEKDGDVKIKQGNVKIEIDGETGEREVKIDD
jgi:hypothetical protein